PSVYLINFLYYLRLLFCARNTIHKNLCVSLLLQSLILMLLSSRALLTQNSVDYSQSIIPMNSDFLCKLIKAISIYALMTSVHWMFIEGLSLHTTLYFTPFAKNKHLMKLYYVIGWIIPFVCIALWITAKEAYNAYQSKCWKGYGNSSLIWIITGPMIVALTLNFIFLINIVRLLTSKLREGLEKKKTFKTIKATALLIPLLGLEHLVFCINPRGSSPELEGIYIVVNAAIQSLQGIAVSFLYCFTNNEVISHNQVSKD
ncbi:corticotropin-releasing factor receptor 1-like protein, partial [Leptotrombidium deliense]